MDSGTLYKLLVSSDDRRRCIMGLHNVTHEKPRNAYQESSHLCL